MNRPPVAKRIKDARLKAGLSSLSAAKKMELSIAAYDDLEEEDDEAFMSISLNQLRILAKSLSLKPLQLVQENEFETIEKNTTVQELVNCIKENINKNSETVEEFSNRVGWDVSTALDNPDNVWNDWNLDGLQDISREVGVHWEYVLNV